MWVGRPITIFVGLSSLPPSKIRKWSDISTVQIFKSNTGFSPLFFFRVEIKHRTSAAKKLAIFQLHSINGREILNCQAWNKLIWIGYYLTKDLQHVQILLLLGRCRVLQMIPRAHFFWVISYRIASIKNLWCWSQLMSLEHLKFYLNVRILKILLLKGLLLPFKFS